MTVKDTKARQGKRANTVRQVEQGYRRDMTKIHGIILKFNLEFCYGPGAWLFQLWIYVLTFFNCIGSTLTSEQVLIHELIFKCFIVIHLTSMPFLHWDHSICLIWTHIGSIRDVNKRWFFIQCYYYILRYIWGYVCTLNTKSEILKHQWKEKWGKRVSE